MVAKSIAKFLLFIHKPTDYSSSRCIHRHQIMKDPALWP